VNHGFLEDHAFLNSPVHRLSARSKLSAVFLMLTLILILTHLFQPALSIQIMFALAGILAVFTFLSREPLRFLLLRSSLVLPFSGFVILVNSLSGTMDPFQILLVLTRSILSVFTILLLISTTPFQQILTQLSRWKFPGLLVMVIAFMYRYFFVLAKEIKSLEKGVGMRSSKLGGWQRMKTYANILGMLLIRSYERSERIHQAMEMRGFSEESL
jgi:cobalt/nickel transport system permease protein